MTTHESIIKIKNLSKNFHTEGGDIPVLKNINLDINSQDFCMIYGPSGCGKSTLLHHIVGLETPTSGEVIIRGVNISTLSADDRAAFRSEKIGMVYQMWYWVKSLLVWENVALPLLVAGCDEQIAKKKAFKVLSEFDLENYGYKRPVQLSGGEQQRIGIARALINNPWIIIADEPTGNLDTHASDQVFSLLQDLNVNHKRTVIMVTHNLVYLPMATHEVAMQDGKIVSDGTDISKVLKSQFKGVL